MVGGPATRGLVGLSPEQTSAVSVLRYHGDMLKRKRYSAEPLSQPTRQAGKYERHREPTRIS
ncbi:hypothetical protein NSPZN2_100464 [Nitrospira defluvii]|uniref:Transposase n=1 Tax=Nitrospira defluvii TaxID=330214 RepID=A0ABM8R587_9BACT|nr:hypothetical protein NSPZN2_100464 [Nitrospira defluvii]